MSSPVRLTEKGEDLKPVVIALSSWVDRWAASNGPPIIYRHATCGGDVEQQLGCSDCGQIVTNKQVGANPGPGMTVAS